MTNTSRSRPRRTGGAAAARHRSGSASHVTSNPWRSDVSVAAGDAHYQSSRGAEQRRRHRPPMTVVARSSTRWASSPTRRCQPPFRWASARRCRPTPTGPQVHDARRRTARPTATTATRSAPADAVTYRGPDRTTSGQHRDDGVRDSDRPPQTSAPGVLQESRQRGRRSSRSRCRQVGRQLDTTSSTSATASMTTGAVAEPVYRQGTARPGDDIARQPTRRPSGPTGPYTPNDSAREQLVAQLSTALSRRPRSCVFDLLQVPDRHHQAQRGAGLSVDGSGKRPSSRWIRTRGTAGTWTTSPPTARGR